MYFSFNNKIFILFFFFFCFIACNGQKKESKIYNVVSFSDLFNESSNIKFSIKDFDSKDSDIQLFKTKLQNFENSKPEPEDFKIEDLLLLINNETFSNNERYVDSRFIGNGKFFL